jgi:hypothetical protein
MKPVDEISIAPAAIDGLRARFRGALLRPGEEGYNLLHTARMLKDRGGMPAYGNQRSEWDAVGQREPRTPVMQQAGW